MQSTGRFCPDSGFMQKNRKVSASGNLPQRKKQQEGAGCAGSRSVPCRAAGAAASSLAIIIRTW